MQNHPPPPKDRLALLRFEVICHLKTLRQEGIPLTTQLCVILDDHSRLITHAAYCLTGDTVTFPNSLKEAVLRRGLLKEIHARLPESKILLLAIFPRGDKPDDAGRLRNQEINAILQTYADGKTVHWLDIGPSFLNADGTLKRDLMPDALHPNLEGYRVWAEAMKPTLGKLMGGK